MFSERAKDTEILFVGTSGNGCRKTEVENGDTVTLSVDGVEVVVADVVRLGEGRFEGRISGFRSDGSPTAGLAVDAQVRFSEINVFDCVTA